MSSIRRSLTVLLAVSCWLAAEPPVIDGVWSPVERVLAVAPGAIPLIKGRGFATDTFTAVAPPYPMQLGGVKVLIDGAECPILMVSPTAIQAQVPFGIVSRKEGSAVNLTVRNQEGEATKELTLGKTLPSLVTDGRDGNGVAVVLNENLMPHRAPRGGEVVVFQAMGLGETAPSATAGLGANAAEPFMVLKEGVEVWIGGRPAEILWAGLAPNLAGIYQVKVRMPEEGGDTVRLRTEGWREVRASLPQAEVLSPVTDISVEIEPLGVPSRPATWAPILLAARLRASMTVRAGAGPFEVLLENEVARITIAVDPAGESFSVRSVLPTAASRSYDFSSASFKTVDYLAGGGQTPGNVIPASRVPPEYAIALRGLPFPNAAGEAGSVNWPFHSSGRIAAGGRLVLDPDTTPGLASAAWLPLLKDAPATYRAVYVVKVAGEEISRKEVMIPVR